MLAYNILHKKRLLLDVLSEGLDAFLLRSAFRVFPLLFKPLFVASGRCCPEDVLDMLRFEDTQLEGDAERVANYLRYCVRNLEETGEV